MAQLNTRNGVLGKRLAAHLLRRTTYKISPPRIEEFAQKTADEAVEELIQVGPMQYPGGPLYHVNGLPIFELGRVDLDSGQVKPASNGTQFRFAKLLGAVNTWRIYEAIFCPTAHVKIAQWFASLFVLDARAGGGGQYHYHWWRLLLHLSFSDLKTLALKVTTSNNMLTFLDNNENQVEAPNENYSREFLELFTILKGETIELGNYTHYTEADISEAAKVLTGYVLDERNTDPDTGIVSGRAVYNRHDTSDKTFSAAFQGTTITGAANQEDMSRELEDFIDMVFGQLETARAYVRKMYRYFVSDIINEEIEMDIVEPLAIQLQNNGYQHIPILKTLLKSVHFYDEDDASTVDEIIGGKLKTPYDLFCTTINMFEIPNTDENSLQTHFFFNYNEIADEHFNVVGMDLYGPLTVEGFPGYYDAPGYSKNWFSSNNLYERFSYGTSFKRGKVRGTDMDLPYKVDLVKWINDHFDDPAGPGTPEAPIGASHAVELVQNILGYLIPELPLAERYQFYEEKLLGGLSPINWYFTWKDYLDTGEESAVKLALESLYDAILASPEYQTL